MTSFEPIAIVGRGCVLPGALTPGQFWDNIVHGRVNLQTVRGFGTVHLATAGHFIAA